MLTLDLTNAPRWHDLAPGVRVQLRPLTTALMVATRSDAAVDAVPEDASDEERAVAFAKALGAAGGARLGGHRRRGWQFHRSEPGGHRRPSRRLADSSRRSSLTYVSKGLLLEQEKNASALSPNGPSAGASATAKPARKPARTARRG